MAEDFLYKEFDTLSKRGRLDKNIDADITDNLNQKFPIRPYQIESFARFVDYYNDADLRKKPTHLLFNMATGSGKTYVMAGLILYLYKQGYRNFLFFVNSNNIIDKTKDNFLNIRSAKYLFNDKIIFNGNAVHINEVDNFEGTSAKDINICFTTIQKLHGDLKNEKENSITFDDFKDKKIVLLADEAHHGQVKTKNRASPQQGEIDLKDVKNQNIDDQKPSFENTVEKILHKNNENLLLEFTATMNFDNINIKEKYMDKLIQLYDLKEFRMDGFSKDVNILKSDFEEKDRILLAIILNQYRQQVAGEHNINLKPVILFKAHRLITESKDNQTKFNKMIENLSIADIENIKNRCDIAIIKKAFEFFENHDIKISDLVKILQRNFAHNKCLNVNEESLDKKSINKATAREIQQQQKLLNSLEDDNNEIRAIFAVNKLDEGWDVLNLFDIVRLYTTRDAKDNRPGKTTISEAQLIGRGARYYPIEIEGEQEKYKRKFDKDIDNELRILEELHYHSFYESRYINEITRALIEAGIYDDNYQEYHLTLKEDFKKKQIYENGFIYLNKQMKNTNDDIKSFADLKVSKKNIAYNIASGAGKVDAVFDNANTDYHLETVHDITSKDVAIRKLPLNVVSHAIDKNPFYRFNNLRTYFPHLSSISDFISNKNYLANIEIKFKGRDSDLSNISHKDYLAALLKLLKQIEIEIKAGTPDNKGTLEFKPILIKEVFGDKVLRLNPNSEQAKGQQSFLTAKEWYAYNANYGTSEEKEFIKMMDGIINEFKQLGYDDIYILRNESFKKCKIYNFDDGRAFMPDFVMFMNDKDNKILTYQYYLEPKGNHLKQYDEWKADFLNQITEHFEDNIIKLNNNKHYRLIGMPFYNQKDENVFKEAMQKSVLQ